MFDSLFTKKWSVESVADAILQGIVNFEPMQVWSADLSTVRGLETARFRKEVFYLDCFAVYFIIKFSNDPGWKAHGMQVFEKVIASCVSHARTTFSSKTHLTLEEHKIVTKEIDIRFAEYAHLIESSAAGFGDTLKSIGTGFAKFCQVEGNATLIMIGSLCFNARGEMATKFIKEHPLKT